LQKTVHTDFPPSSFKHHSDELGQQQHEKRTSWWPHFGLSQIFEHKRNPFGFTNINKTP